MIDTAAAKQRRIVVSNVPDYSTEAVAQHMFALLLESTNHVGLHAQSVAAGDWVRCRDFCYWKAPLKELAGQTIGLIGYGKIGRRVAQIARAFSMQVQALARPGKSYEEQTDVRFVSMETLLATSDVVSLHCPLTTENSGMIGDGELKKMKRGAVLFDYAAHCLGGTGIPCTADGNSGGKPAGVFGGQAAKCCVKGKGKTD